MRNFLENHTLGCLVVALALLLTVVIIAIYYSWQCLDDLEFFIVWLVIGGLSFLAFAKIVNAYEKLEIKKFHKTKRENIKTKRIN